MGRLKFWVRWHFTHDGAWASILYHTTKDSPRPITKDQAMTQIRAARRRA